MRKVAFEISNNLIEASSSYAERVYKVLPKLSISASGQTYQGVSAFNWWEENCCIFLKKISSPNAFYVFLPLFKYQTTPYNVLFFQKIKKYAFLFSFQTGTRSQ